MNKITNANMFNWAKKKEKHQTEEPTVRRKGSFSLTDTLRKSVMKTKFKESKKDVDTTPQKPPVSKKNPRIPNGSTQTNTENVNVNTDINRLPVHKSDTTANDAKISKELKRNYENIIYNRNQESSLEVSEDISRKEELNKSKILSQISFEKEDITLSKKENSNLSNDKNIYENVIVNNETMCQTVQESQMNTDDSKINIEELKDSGENTLNNTNQELHLKVNEHESNKNEIKELKRISEINLEKEDISFIDKDDSNLYSKETTPENFNVNNEISQLTVKVAQMTAEIKKISIEELKINDENILHTTNQISLLVDNEDELNKEEVEKYNLNNEETNPEDINVNDEPTQLTIQEPPINTDDTKINIEDLKTKDENVQHNRNQESSIKINKYELNKEEEQNTNRISQISLEKEDIFFTEIKENNLDNEEKEAISVSEKEENNLDNEESNLKNNIIPLPTVRVSTMRRKEELETNDENSLHNRNQDNNLDNEETDPINNEKEDIFISEKEESNLDNEEANLKDNKIPQIKDELDKVEEQKTNRISLIILEKEDISFTEIKENNLDNEEKEDISVSEKEESNLDNEEANFKNNKIPLPTVRVSTMRRKEELETNDENSLHNRNQDNNLDNEETDPINNEKEDISISKKEESNLDNEEANLKNNKIPQIKDELDKVEEQKTNRISLIILEKEDIAFTEIKENNLDNEQKEDISVSEKEESNLDNEEANFKNNKIPLPTVRVSTMRRKEELETNDENSLHNSKQELSIEDNDDESKKEEEQSIKRISQISLEEEDILISTKEDNDLNNEETNPENIIVNNETTELNVPLCEMTSDDIKVTTEELEINDKNILQTRNKESSLEVNEDESNKEEVQKSRRISQISIETEDLSFSIKKEGSNLDNEEFIIDSSDGKGISRNSSIRRSIKVELTIFESENNGRSRKYSQTLLDKEIDVYSFNKSEKDYPEELNPFAEDEDEEIISNNQEVAHSEKQKVNNNHYNPFDSESDSEDTIHNENNKNESVENSSDFRTLEIKNNNLSECTSLTRRNKNVSKPRELPGGSLPPSPKAPARRRLPQARSLQCLQECGKPTHLLKSGSIHTTSSGISSAGSNPFEDDDDENVLEETSGKDKTKLQVEAQRIRPGRPPSPSLSLNNSVSSMHSTPSKSLNGSTQYNPFNEDEEDEELQKATAGINILRGATSRSSLAVSPSNDSFFNRDTEIRCSLPPSARPRKKRQAPLPPGQVTQVPPTVSNEKGLNAPLQRRTLSTLSLSPRRPPPPRPPPPRMQKIV